MLKRINVEHLKLGMHLHQLCGSWLSHPFWRTSFLLNDPKDLQGILDSGIQEVWIDVGKGFDVDPGQSNEEMEEPLDHEPTAVAGRIGELPRHTETSKETLHAARIFARSKKVVVSMFQEVRMGHAIKVADALPLVEEIYLSVMRNPGALISLARLKTVDNYTYMHSLAVCALMIALAQQLQLDERQACEAGLAGLLHDVGKMAIPLEVLNKSGKLTEAESALMRTHPEQGYKMLLQAIGISKVVRDVCLQHHEKADASGYPQRLGADVTALFAKMCAVCDVYDAITSDRPYKKAWNPAEALREMAQRTHGHFEITLFQAFVKTVGIYPVGTLVRLQSGRLGVVVDQSRRSLLAPLVKVFFSTKSQVRLAPEIVDLASPGCSDKIVAFENPDEWDFPDMEALWLGVNERP